MNSNHYWNNVPKNGRATAGGFRFEHMVADAVGGYNGASWGALAGPIGSVVVGVNGAIIASGSAYFWGNIPWSTTPKTPYEPVDGFVNRLNTHYKGATDIREFALK